MSFLIKLLLFILFLVMYGAWFFLSVRIFVWMQKDPLNVEKFAFKELMVLIPLVAFLAFVWVLSGFFDWRLLGLLFAGFQLGFVILGILWAFWGSTESPWAYRGTWAGAEFGMKHPWVMIVCSVLSLMVLIAYPAVAGIVYFRHVIPSDRVTLLIFRYTLVGMFLPGYLTLLPVLFGVLSSKNLDESTRTRYLAAQISGLISSVLILGLIFWSFGIPGQDYGLTRIGIPMTISPLSVFVLFSFFVCTVLLPYSVGVRQAKKWRIYLQNKEQRWIGRLLDVLDFPMLASYGPSLDELQGDIQSECERFRESDEMFVLLERADSGESPTQLPPTERNIIVAIRACRNLDPRVKYADFLDQLHGRIEEVHTESDKAADDDDRSKIATAFAQAYRSRREELADEMEAAKSTRPGAAVGLAAIFGAVLTAVLSKFGEWIWEIFAKTLGS